MAIARIYVTAATGVAIVVASIVGSPVVARALGSVCVPTPANLVCNGDFSADNIGFSSDYAYSPSGLGGPGAFAVATDPSSLNGAWPAMGDHTTGSGKMMIINGATVPNQRVWSETVQVVPGTEYQFSTWLASLYANPAVLQLSVDGVAVGAPFVAPSQTGIWTNQVATWGSGTSTTVVLSIVDQNTGFNGNDFALDDISLSATVLATRVQFTVTPPAQSCTIPCRLNWVVHITDATTGRGIARAKVYMELAIPDPQWAPGAQGDNGGKLLRAYNLVTGAQGMAGFGYYSSTMAGVQLIGVASGVLPDGSPFASPAPKTAGYYVEPGRRPSVGLLVFWPEPTAASGYGVCSATVVGSVFDASTGVGLNRRPSTLVTAGHCAGVGHLKFWFYPGALHCDFSSVLTSNDSAQCAPLGVWPAQIMDSVGSSGKVTNHYETDKWTAEDFGFVTLAPDPLSGATTIDQVVRGLPLVFNQKAGRWQAWGDPEDPGNPSVTDFKICTIPRTSVVAADKGPGVVWQGPCSALLGGASGGPWINLSRNPIPAHFSVGAVNSQVVGSDVRGAPLTTAAEDLYRSLP